MTALSSVPESDRAPRTQYKLSSAERWYAVQTIAKREVKAQFELSRQGFRTFLPALMRTVRHARKTRNARVAAFPGYIFIILDLERDRWRAVNSTIGVSRLVMGNNLPLPAPVGIVETLLDYSDENGICCFDRDLVVGQKVRVISGPLAAALGTWDRLDGNGRGRVLLEILGGQALATIDRGALEAA